MNYQAAASSYNTVRNHTAIEDASPHKLVQMLFDGALERIVQAKGALEYKNMELKGKKINGAINIINGLRENLNHDDAEDIAGNLEVNYEYITRILSEAHFSNDLQKLDEAYDLLNDIASAWKEIA